MKVWPRDEELRKVLRHPIAGKFREIGPGDWPDDSYTYRRIKDGVLLTVAPPELKAPSRTKEIKHAD